MNNKSTFWLWVDPANKGYTCLFELHPDGRITILDERSNDLTIDGEYEDITNKRASLGKPSNDLRRVFGVYE